MLFIIQKFLHVIKVKEKKIQWNWMKLSKLTGGADRIWHFGRGEIFPLYLLPANAVGVTIYL